MGETVARDNYGDLLSGIMQSHIVFALQRTIDQTEIVIGIGIFWIDFDLAFVGSLGIVILVQLSVVSSQFVPSYLALWIKLPPLASKRAWQLL